MRKFFDKKAGVKTRTALVEITIARTPKTAAALHEVCASFDMHANDIFSFTQGIKEVTIITEKKYEKTILNVLKKSKLIKRIDNLSALSVFLPEQAYETQGVLYLAMKTMYDAGINIIEVFSTLTELTIIVDEEDTEDARDALKDMVLEYS
jgi:aspartokinase